MLECDRPEISYFFTCTFALDFTLDFGMATSTPCPGGGGGYRLKVSLNNELEGSEELESFYDVCSSCLLL